MHDTAITHEIKSATIACKVKTSTDPKKPTKKEQEIWWRKHYQVSGRTTEFIEQAHNRNKRAHTRSETRTDELTATTSPVKHHHRCHVTLKNSRQPIFPAANYTRKSALGTHDAFRRLPVWLTCLAFLGPGRQQTSHAGVRRLVRSSSSPTEIPFHPAARKVKKNENNTRKLLNYQHHRQWKAGKNREAFACFRCSRWVS